MPAISIAAPYWVPDRAAIARNIEPAGPYVCTLGQFPITPS
ncbi:hypothetical protein [Halopseudomonas bauzanensis]|nr:hypothetical protein [Halopseudomonas bauzanensis]